MNAIHRWAAFFILVGGAVQAASPAPVPAISLSPSSFTIDVPVGGPNPAPSTLTITNSGSGNLDWTAAETPDQPWLSVSPSSGRLHTAESIGITVSVNVLLLAAGTYNGTITVSAAGVTSQNATVQLKVNATPKFGLSPTSFTFAAPEGGVNPASQTLTIQNTGTGTLDWSAVLSQSWLQLSPAPQDLGPAASQDIQVSVLIGSLAAGTHNATIQLSAPGAASPPPIGVTVTINANPAIGLTPTSLTFDAPQGGPNPASKTFTVKNNGGGTLTWSATDSATWLTLNPAGGSLASGQSQVVTATADVLVPSALVESTYLATVTVTATAPVTNSPQTLGVTLNVNSIPKIGLSSENLSFTFATDTVSPPPTAISVTNAGSGTLNWSVTGGAPWVSFFPSGGSLGTLSSQPLTVEVIPFRMTPGVYTTTLQIVAPGASNSPKTLSVEMTVTPSSLPTTAPAGQCGLLGLEMLAVFLLLRSLKSRGGPSCTSR